MGMEFLSFHDLQLYYLTQLLKCAFFFSEIKETKFCGPQ